MVVIEKQKTVQNRKGKRSQSQDHARAGLAWLDSAEEAGALKDVEDALARLAGALDKGLALQLLGRLPGLVGGDGATALALLEAADGGGVGAQVHLEADEHDGHVWAEVLDLLDPLFVHVVERVGAVDREGDKDDVRVRVRERAQAVVVLLAGRVPQRQLDALAVGVRYVLDVVLEHGGHVGVGVERVVGKADQQAGLAAGAVAHDYQLAAHRQPRRGGRVATPRGIALLSLALSVPPLLWVGREGESYRTIFDFVLSTFLLGSVDNPVDNNDSRQAVRVSGAGGGEWRRGAERERGAGYYIILDWTGRGREGRGGEGRMSSVEEGEEVEVEEGEEVEVEEGEEVEVEVEQKCNMRRAAQPADAGLCHPTASTPGTDTPAQPEVALFTRTVCGRHITATSPPPPPLTCSPEICAATADYHTATHSFARRLPRMIQGRSVPASTNRAAAAAAAAASHHCLPLPTVAYRSRPPPFLVASTIIPGSWHYHSWQLPGMVVAIGGWRRRRWWWWWWWCWWWWVVVVVVVVVVLVVVVGALFSADRAGL